MKKRYYEQKYSMKKLSYRISLSVTAVFENTFSENGAVTVLRCCVPVACAHFLMLFMNSMVPRTIVYVSRYIEAVTIIFCIDLICSIF